MHVWSEAESAKSLDRPGMERLLAIVERGEVDAVIIAKLDRITRSVKDLAETAGAIQPPPAWRSSVSPTRSTRPQPPAVWCSTSWFPFPSGSGNRFGERTQAAMSHLKAAGFLLGMSVSEGFVM
jgi:site-specific DNA recombinase